MGLALIASVSSAAQAEVLRYDEARLHQLLDPAPSVARFDSLRATLFVPDVVSPPLEEPIRARRDEGEAALLAALRAAEEGDTLRAAEFDTATLAAEAARRAALTLEAGRALDRGDGALAHRCYSRLDSLWREASSSVPGAADALDLWMLWSRQAPRWARAGSADSLPGDGLLDPTREEWQRLTTLVQAARAEREALALLQLRRRLLVDARSRDLRYAQAGRDRLDAELAAVARASALLDSLAAEIDQSMRALDEGAERAADRLESRVDALAIQARVHEQILRAQSDLFLEGPKVLAAPHDSLARPLSARESEITARDAADLQALGGRFRAMVAALRESGWRPEVRARLADLAAELVATRNRAANDRDMLDIRNARDPRAAEIASIDAEVARRGASWQALADGYQTARAEIAQAAIARAHDWLARERERIDYGLAASLHEWSRTEARERAAAIEAIDVFLRDHPDSRARADLRYRLAEAQLAEGQAHPASFDPARPLALFRAIWDSDPDYGHRDVALFQIGRLETELGDPEGARALASFLERFPNSGYAQEAELRLADLAFDERDYATAIPYFERASRGASAPLAGIALYKLGWSYYGRDQFDDAAAAFTRLLDLYESGELANARFDLRGEAEEILVHSLARGGGASAYRHHFAALGARPYEERVLRGLASLLADHSLFAEAIEADRLYLDRFGSRPEALQVARGWIEATAHRNRPAEEETARLELAERFQAQSAWSVAASDSLREEGDRFARGLTREAAEARHVAARRSDRANDWDGARQLYARLLTQWPADAASAAWELASGEACAHLARHDEAAEHFHRAAARPGALADEAAFQELASLDAGYRAEQVGSHRAARARRFLEASSRFRAAHSADARGADLLLREGHLGLLHASELGSDSLGTRALSEFASRFEEDPRAPQAMAELAAHFQKQGARAQSASTLGELARRWPDREDAPVALYKSGATYAALDSTARAAQAFERVARAYPNHELARDAMLELARVQEGGGDSSAAAASYAQFSARYPRDDDAGAALLRAIALWDGRKDDAHADPARRDYLARYPDDLDARFEFQQRFARREFEERRAAGSLDALLATPVKKGKKSAPLFGDLALYRELVARYPERADRDFLAEVDFARAEELRASYDVLALSLPLERSISAKQSSLERCLSSYRAVLEHRAPRWSSAATFRMGEVVVAFGDALRASPRPPDLAEADRAGYESLLEDQAWSFFDRGEAIWGELLRASGEDAPDPDGWIERTRHALWPRVAARFLHYPEAMHPTLLPDEGRND